ncbi:Calpain [Entamoeba marina]
MFTDSQFTADLSSIGKIDSIIPSDLTFLRPNEFMKKVNLYEDGIDPTDIQQGCLGDCYFLASLAALAEFPKRIKQLIKPLGNGKYEIVMYYQGTLTSIIIDDLIPCHQNQPFFSRNSGNELWVILIEKAYAKVVGNYGLIEGGVPFLALSDLTGMPVKRIMTRDMDPIRLWKKINSCDKKQYVLTANVPSADSSQQYGLVENHAYSVIDAYDVEDNLLLKIRNPWGEGEWNGKWSDKDTNWTSSMKKQVNMVDANDGIFFMDIHDFVKHFDEITILYYKDDYTQFTSYNVNLTEKQTAVTFITKGDAIISLVQARTEDKLALRMWCVDESEQPIGGNTDETFVVSSNIRCKKLKVKEGTYTLLIETHQSYVSKLPFNVTLSVRSKSAFAFIGSKPLKQNERIAYMTKESLSDVEKCKACGLPLPPRGIAKTKIGSFHLKCFTCDLCKEQLGSKFGLRGTTKLCPDCVSKK